MRNIVLIQFLVMVCLTCQAQPPSSQSIKWSVSELTDLKADTVQNYESHFVTYKSEKIVWIQKKREDTFLINALHEDWSDVNASGHIKYGINIAGQSGTLAVVRHENLIEISLAITNAAGEQLEYKFKVESFQAL